MAGVTTRISAAIDRPFPLAFCSSVWVTTPSSTKASCARTCDCWLAGNTSMMRLIASAALLVCSVARAKWPVSAMVRQALMVSRSRNSPTRITSGSSRRAYLSADPKLLVSVPTSRWLTMQPWCRWMNSIGSSTVMMCPFRSLLILSIIAASVVLLPEPVGPVTRMRPRGLSASLAMTGGSPSCWNVSTLKGIIRMTIATQPRCLNTLPRKRARFWMPKEKSSSLSFSNFFFWFSVSTE